MKYSSFEEHSFCRSVETALQKVNAILVTTKNPRLAHEDSDHTYDDKYALAEFIGNTSVSAQLAVLEQLGLTSAHLKTVLGWVHEENQTVTLQFQAKDSCSFLKEESVEIVLSSAGEMEQESVTQYEGRSTIFGISSGARTKKTKHRIVHKVKEYHWNVDVSYELVMYKGNDRSTTSAIELLSRRASSVVITTLGDSGTTEPIPPPSPIAEKTVHSPVKVQITWLVQSIDPKTLSPTFSIERNRNVDDSSSCKTPRRNQEVDEAFAFHDALGGWLMGVLGFLENRLEDEIPHKHDRLQKKPDPKRFDVGARCVIVNLQQADDAKLNGKLVIVREYQVMGDRYRVEPAQDEDRDLFSVGSNGTTTTRTLKKANLRIDVPKEITLNSLNKDDVGIFSPILPLLENGTLLPVCDVNALLDAQKQSIQESIETFVNKVFPPSSQSNKLISQTEASLFLLVCHWKELLEGFKDGIDYIENMLRKQLIQAIGKEVDAHEFDKFMRFHNQRLFAPRFAPKPFTYAIRRPRHFPDGVLSITSKSATTTTTTQQPIETMVRKVSGADSPSIFIPINAATSIEITGDRYLHGWLQHRFESSSALPEFQLEARARQFSSFLLMVGTMAGRDKFDPKAAIILQNKDEVVIPLLTNVLPTAKEFKDAIASLSPEQQVFCRAFREMQLESSVFGICIVQLKPQLEKLLGLPPGGLTKEIQLTQDLMSLFVDHQIPSDLLSFAGEETASGADKLTAVKGHVKAVMDVIEAEKERQLKEEERKAEMRQEELWASDENLTRSGFLGHDDESAQAEGRRVGLLGRKKSRHKAVPMAAGECIPTIGFMPTIGYDLDRVLERARCQEAVDDEMDFEDDGGFEGGFDEEDCCEEEDFGVESKEVFPAGRLSGQSPSQTNVAEDFTLIPKTLDAKFLQLDTDNALRSTTLETGVTWSRMRQDNLLVALRTSSLREDDIKSEKNKAYDLLDAISRSGTLPIDCAELHVVICVSHCFENDIMGTVIQDNINPIEKVEKSSLIIGSTIHGEHCGALLSGGTQQAGRLKSSFPALFVEN